MDELVKNACAKVNLSLDVIGRRPDGYHEIRTVMQHIGLHDVLRMKKTAEKGIVLLTNDESLPTDGKNLAVRAAKLLFDEFGLPGGLLIRLEKNIPVAAGLAGGSADAAAVLHGVNELYGLGLSLEALQARGVKLGADIPFCLTEHAALSEGIGEILTEIPGCPACTLVLAKPDAGASTKEIYERLDHCTDAVHPDVDRMLRMLENGDLRGTAEVMGNILEDVTVQLCPEIREIEAFFKENGALNAMMSGSGPTVFALFDAAEKAEQAVRLLKEKKIAAVTVLTRLI